MKQIWIPKSGPPEVMTVHESADPLPRSGEVRIRVEAIGVNFVDVTGRLGLLPEAPRMPFVPGLEVAGSIELVGQGVPDLKEDDSVLALVHFGGYCDTICVPHKQVFKRLEWMNAVDGASLPFSYLTAYLALNVMGSLRRGDRVLIHSAASGLGVAAIDLCKIGGAEIYGTASPEKHEFLLERGVHFPIDHLNQDYERASNDLTAGRGFQIILDSWGGSHWKKNYRLLMPTGRLLCLGAAGMDSRGPGKLLNRLRYKLGAPTFSPARLLADNRGVLGVNLARLWERMDLVRNWMEQIITWYDEALFRPHIDRQYPLEQAVEAHRHVQAQKNSGKVLLLP